MSQDVGRFSTTASDDMKFCPLQPPKVVRIAIGDQEPVFRYGLRQLLGCETDFQIVAEAADGRDVLHMLRDYQPDILLLDLRLPRLSGFAVLEMLKGRKLPTRVIVVTSSPDEADYVRAMRLGAWGIVPKRTASELLAKSIRRVDSGEVWLDLATMSAVIREFASQEDVRSGGRGSPLTAREREVVLLVAHRLTNKQIAERMFISAQTVKNHLHNVFEKLGCTDRLQLALYAIQQEIQPEAASVANGRSTVPQAPLQITYNSSVSTGTSRTLAASRATAVA